MSAHTLPDFLNTVLPEAVLSISLISPDNGSTGGGTAVTINGGNFSDAMSVSVGGSSASSVVVVDRRTLTAVTPSGSAGSVDVVITDDRGRTSTLSGAFLYAVPEP